MEVILKCDTSLIQNKIAELQRAVDTRINELKEALALTQHVFNGSFEKGYTVFLTGHQMRVIQKLLDR